MLALKDRLRARRIELRLSQPQVAERAGLNQTNISRWETGTEPPASAIPKLAKALHCSVTWLLLGEEDSAYPLEGRLGAMLSRLSTLQRDTVADMLESMMFDNLPQPQVLRASDSATELAHVPQDSFTVSKFRAGDRYQVIQPIHGVEDRYLETTFEVVEARDVAGKCDGTIVRPQLP